MLVSSLRSARSSRIVAPYTRSLRLTPLRRTYASVTDLSSLPQPGSSLHGFTLQRAKHIPELELSALHFQHDKTGADYLHVARDDKNNVFSIGFKTNPPDATGVPHILEHVTLCGSEKYPVVRRLMSPTYAILRLSLTILSVTARPGTYVERWSCMIHPLIQTLIFSSSSRCFLARCRTS